VSDDLTTVTRSPRLLRGRIRTVVVAAVSLLVILTGAAYVFAPSGSVLEMSLDELSSVPAYDRDITADYSLAAATVAERKRYKETIWGALVSPAGVPVSKAKLVIKGVPEKLRKHQAVIRIGGVGTFRSIVHLKPGKYRFTMSLLADGRPRQASKVRKIRHKGIYGVGVAVRESGFLTMLPISTY
jgi:hypothetical protein